MPDPLKKKIRMIHAPFDFMRKNRAMSVIRQTGVMEVDHEIADAAIKAGAAVAFNSPKRAPAKRKSYKPTSTTTAASGNDGGDAADTAKSDDVDREDLAADGGADSGEALDPDTE